MCLLEAFNSYNYSRCIQSRIGGNMAFCWHCWQHDDSWGGDGTSKRRWRVGNIGAEQDEGITSPEIKGQASHTHQKQDHRITEAPNISHLLPADLQKVSFYLLSTACLSEEGCVLPASERVCLCVWRMRVGAFSCRGWNVKKKKIQEARLSWRCMFSDSFSLFVHMLMAFCLTSEAFPSLSAFFFYFFLFEVTLQLRSPFEARQKQTITQTSRDKLGAVCKQIWSRGCRRCCSSYLWPRRDSIATLWCSAGRRNKMLRSS